MQTLNGTWRIAMDRDHVGREEAWYTKARPRAKTITVPGCIQEIFPAYHGVAWFWCETRIAANPHPGGRTLLRFRAVDYLADVWINGTHVGAHEGGEAPFVLDITRAAKPDRRNLIAVRVLNPTHDGIDGIKLAETPHMMKGYPIVPGKWCYFNSGGIVDDVELIHAPAVRIDDLHVCPDWKTGKVRVAVTVKTSRRKSSKARLQVSIAPALGGAPADAATVAFTSVDTNVVRAGLKVENYQLWDINDPQLYRVTATVCEEKRPQSFDQATTRCGFRDFRVEDGHFRLNGRRIFLRSAHTAAEYPIGLLVPRDKRMDLLDIAYAKGVGLNCIRYLANMPRRHLLDLCDEMGMMMIEGNHAGWGMQPSPRQAGHFDRALREMLLRDRNHPCIVAWEMLNETLSTDPLVAHAGKRLGLLRRYDPDRLVLFNSGSWDFEVEKRQGCMSNPGSKRWDIYLGFLHANPDRKDFPAQIKGKEIFPGSHALRQPLSGDVHFYPVSPEPLEMRRLMRRMGEGVGPVFVSEYGQGSAVDLARFPGQYDQAGGGRLAAAAAFRMMQEIFMADWERFGMREIFGRPEDYFRLAQGRMASQRYWGIATLRANPNVIGYSATSLRDIAHTGEGFWTCFREWKPGLVDALSDAYTPLLFCLSVEPDVIYRGGSIRIEATLANEDVLPPGTYPVRLEIFGPDAESVWRKRVNVRIPGGREKHPFAIRLFKGRVTIKGPAGPYRFTATMEEGGAPRGWSAAFRVEDARTWPSARGNVVGVWGEDEALETWLRKRGIKIATRAARRGPIFVGRTPPADADKAFADLYRRVRAGATVVFLSTQVFGNGEERDKQLPPGHAGAVVGVPSDLYMADNWCRAHPLFDGLPCGGLMDDAIYRELLSAISSDGSGWRNAWNNPRAAVGDGNLEEAVAGTNRCGMHPGTGYLSGLLLSVHRHGKGRIVFNTLKVLENLDENPAADRLMLNLIRFAAEKSGGKSTKRKNTR